MAIASVRALAPEPTHALEGRASDALLASADGSTPEHRRFARAAIWIYCGAAALTVGLLVAALVADLAQEQGARRQMLERETELRARSFAWYLGLLENELRRLGLRSEVNLLDQNMEPERSLLELSHNESAFFNVGVAIVAPDGTVAWSEPRSFRTPGVSLADEAWFRAVRTSAAVRVEPVREAGGGHSLVYVVSPIIRGGQFSGVLLGGIDVASESALRGEDREEGGVATVLATRAGTVVHPPVAPSFALDPEWSRLVHDRSAAAFVADATLAGRGTVVAGSPVACSDLVLLSIGDARSLFAAARTRLIERLAIALVLTTVPLVILFQALRRSLASLRRSEEESRREGQLRRLGEAVNMIAHEITNSLNSLRVGLDLAFAGGAADGRRRALTAAALRSEVGRLTEFATELLIFSKGIRPRPVEVDLAERVRQIVDLHRPRASEQGVVLDLEAEPAIVTVDPNLLHVVVTNLVTNALDSVAMCEEPVPRVAVRVERRAGTIGVRVSDNGPGVATAVRPRLFEPFVSGKPSGVGIGLALSRKIARAHGGELALAASGSGATFELTLPAGETR